MNALSALLVMWMVGGGIFAAWMWRNRWSPEAKLRRRALALGARVAAAHDEAGLRRRLIQDKLKELERQRERRRRDDLVHVLAQSGLDLDVKAYVLICVGVGLVAALALGLAGMTAAVWLPGGGAAGYLLPRLYLNSAVKRRRRAFLLHFADALDILVRGARSGLPVGECLRIVARESPEPVGPEFAFLTESQRVGMTLRQALTRCVDRMPVAELRFFAIVLTVQQQTGGNLAATLENLAHVLRARKRLRDKVTAMSSEARASAAIIGSLPFIVAALLTLVSPDYMAPLFHEKTGHVLIIGGLAWMGLGVFVMHQMINFES